LTLLSCVPGCLCNSACSNRGNRLINDNDVILPSRMQSRCLSTAESLAFGFLPHWEIICWFSKIM
jgi:hypothetical protein